ncbi:MAG TPA: type II toxin-antitoxin system VapC family toxin [Candidatus Agrococcus pullicola]|uniref:Ribonuclease VapC n=1 Tax=Candidatus Agrococcus pullicola TaxID=2838429 RepID=A0A9D1YXM9_9MICO|nr:type II toxin-antitoxin system VapC family toxin [Candidatus Agrococcus pullicola]
MILIDTDVLICHLRGVEIARRWLLDAAESDALAISAVTVTEITGGMRSAERREVWALLAALEVMPITDAIARRAGALRREHRRSHSGIGIPDYFIAATVLHHGLELATLNTKHFPMIPELRAPFSL